MNFLLWLKQYLWNVCFVIPDLALSALTGGSPYETISSRSGKYVRRGRGWFPCQLCKLLNWFQADHCIRSIEEDLFLDKISKGT
jgi:hypothetical protein